MCDENGHSHGLVVSLSVGAEGLSVTCLSQIHEVLRGLTKPVRPHPLCYHQVGVRGFIGVFPGCLLLSLFLNAEVASGVKHEDV